MKKWIKISVTAIVVLLGIGLSVGYTQIFPKVYNRLETPEASPQVLGAIEFDPNPVLSVDEWEARRKPLLQQAFSEHIYGPPPPDHPVIVLKTEALNGKKLGRNLTVEQISLGIGDKSEFGQMRLVLVLPKDKPVRGLIIMQNFCGNVIATRSQLPEVSSVAKPPEMCGSLMGQAAKIILGNYINAPPFERITQKGYGIAMVYTGDLVPDSRALSGPALAKLFDDKVPGVSLGALSAWAFMYDKISEALRHDPKWQSQLSKAKMIAWGHSRNGKAALLAGARYSRIDIVIAHQSGRGGSSLNRSDIGESIVQITNNYGYWFNSRFADYAGQADKLPIDQHMLIALNAPNPVLITTGNRDLWSDPASSVRALEGASPVYELYGQKGFKADKLNNSDFSAPLAFAMRPGPHGVRTIDWTMFLEFLDKHCPEIATLKTNNVLLVQ